MKSDKGEPKPHHISIPQKDAIAIVPPKKVRSSLPPPALLRHIAYDQAVASTLA
jgi:hypothetical protein